MGYFWDKIVGGQSVKYTKYNSLLTQITHKLIMGNLHSETPEIYDLFKNNTTTNWSNFV